MKRFRFKKFETLLSTHREYLLFEVNTKHVSPSVMKTSEFSRVRSVHFYIIHFIGYEQATCNVSPTEKGGAEKCKTVFF